MRIMYWSSDGCSSELDPHASPGCTPGTASPAGWPCCPPARPPCRRSSRSRDPGSGRYRPSLPCFPLLGQVLTPGDRALPRHRPLLGSSEDAHVPRSEEHTSELQSLMRISYAVFCLKKKKINYTENTHTRITIFRT